MTQVASRQTVMAPFSGEQLEVQGVRAQMDWDGDAPMVRIYQGEEELLTGTVRLTVGSHRYQQYVAEIRGPKAPPDAVVGSTLGEHGTLWRLPVAWYPEYGRWIHMNTAFLEPDEFEPDSYFRHLNRWNDNCVFCHNVDPVPGKVGQSPFETEVAELGIACGSCHGDGRRHVAALREPWRAAFGRPLSSDMTHPGELDAPRANDVCGRCHGQRIAHDLDSVLAGGDGFAPGMELGAISRPIEADSTINGQPVPAFESRFWSDGSPRLSAYEYQALVGSACAADGGGISCGDCHDMHRAGPSDSREPMQLLQSVANDPDSPCATCHPSVQHGGHDKIDAGCVDCHMPPQTYGLLSALISHRIQSPRPASLVGRDDQGDACTSCHVDRSRSWAVEGLQAIGFEPVREVATPALHEAWASRVELDLVGGDPIQRALSASALGSSRAAGNVNRRARWLVEALEDDYAVVRVVAHRGLEALGQGSPQAREAFDPFAGPEVRALAVTSLRAEIGAVPLPDEQLETLRDRQSTKRISIGE